MEVNKCPNCGASLGAAGEEYTTTCPYCGSTLFNKDRKPKEPEPKPNNELGALFSDAKPDFSETTSKIKFNFLVFLILLIFMWPIAIVYAVICKIAKNVNNDKNNRR